MIQNLQDGVAAKGHDVVAFFQGHCIKGDPSVVASYNDANYFFSSKKNKQAFVEAPEKFVPQYGGYCSIAMSEGALADPNPKSNRIQDGKLYFFTRMFMGIVDVQRQWAKDPNGKRALADAEYEKMTEVEKK